MISNYVSFIAAALLAENGPARGPAPFWASPWFPFVLIAVLFYFLLIRPERRKRSEVNQMLDSLKKNDHVVTIGGIHGVVVNAPKGSEDITIRVDESSNVKLRVLRSAISRVVKATEEGEKTDAS